MQGSLLTTEFLVYFSEKKSKPIEGTIARVQRELIADLGTLPHATILTLLISSFSGIGVFSVRLSFLWQETDAHLLLESKRLEYL